MDPFSRRLQHIVTRSDWVILLVSSYAAAHSVDDDVAEERLTRALSAPGLVDELQAALAEALRQRLGPRTAEDQLLDRFSKALQKRRARVRPMVATPETSAVLVRVDLEIGMAPEALRETLQGERGAALLGAGFRRVASHLVEEILK